MTVSRTISDVLSFIQSPETDTFEALALEVFAYQFSRNEPYRNLCRRQRKTPDSVVAWDEIPKVPTSAFKHTRLNTGEETVKIFRTSGTTQGVRGEHHLPSLSLYEASWRCPFQEALIPENKRIRMLSLIPPEQEAPDSSLSWMTARALAAFGTADSATLFSEGGIQVARVEEFLEEAIAQEEPVLIVGTTFSLAHALDRLRDRERRFFLPAGSRIMDTGGFKGRHRNVRREDLIEAYARVFGIAAEHVVGEYGMTEMCSQFYEDPRTRAFHGPRWVRSQVLDPFTLEPLPGGRRGLVAHFDLANAWTVSGVVTEDLGVIDASGLHLAGRAGGAELRGCSLTTEELLNG